MTPEQITAARAMHFAALDTIEDMKAENAALRSALLGIIREASTKAPNIVNQAGLTRILKERGLIDLLTNG